MRPPLKINSFKDSTICFGRSIDIKPQISGGYDSTRVLDWGSSTGNEKIFYPSKDTLLYLVLKDNCTVLPDTARIHIGVRPPLNIKTNKDTTLCFGDSLRLITVSSGGDSLHYHYTWSNGIGSNAKVNFVPDSSHTYTVILTDGCTPVSGSDEVNVRVRRAPILQKRSDSTICKGQSIILFAVPVNGDTDGVSFLWSNGDSTQTTSGHRSPSKAVDLAVAHYKGYFDLLWRYNKHWHKRKWRLCTGLSI